MKAPDIAPGTSKPVETWDEAIWCAFVASRILRTRMRVWRTPSGVWTFDAAGGGKSLVSTWNSLIGWTP